MLALEVTVAVGRPPATGSRKGALRPVRPPVTVEYTAVAAPYVAVVMAETRPLPPQVAPRPDRVAAARVAPSLGQAPNGVRPVRPCPVGGAAPRPDVGETREEVGHDAPAGVFPPRLFARDVGVAETSAVCHAGPARRPTAGRGRVEAPGDGVRPSHARARKDDARPAARGRGRRPSAFRTAAGRRLLAGVVATAPAETASSPTLPAVTATLLPAGAGGVGGHALAGRPSRETALLGLPVEPH